MRTFGSHDAILISLDEFGPESGRKVLLIHGISTSCSKKLPASVMLTPGDRPHELSHWARWVLSRLYPLREDVGWQRACDRSTLISCQARSRFPDS